MHSNFAITGQHGNKQSATNQGLFIQPKLTINQPGDSYEQEADAVAEKVMRKDNAGSGGAAFLSRCISRRRSKCSNQDCS
ncbi:hypothetical protein [Niabella hibiscisoli]|uniref:hypothetical protein n=1 Tax=Niabella hibiscisoli TaxID=1825928 RepID=UPI001F0F771A|nr:hypothetical protein [Niabella hibiscisoli]MCH5716212.1 hypothetical protein [Niabella hibiscisoli]